MPEPATSDPTRAKLLEAAGHVFAEHGFHAATVREICSRAGANVAAVNYYFGDKSELYEEVLRGALCTIHDSELRQALSRVEPEEALRRAIRHLLQRLCDPSRPNWAMLLMTHEMAKPTPALARVINEISGPITSCCAASSDACWNSRRSTRRPGCAPTVWSGRFCTTSRPA